MKKFLFLFSVMSVLILMVACSDTGSENSTNEDDSNNESSEDTVEFTNDYTVTNEEREPVEEVNETVQISKNPEQVVVFDLSALSTIQALGAEESVIGVPKGEASNMLPESLTSFDSDEYENVGALRDPDFEKIAELQPEVIMISNRQASDAYLEEFRRAAPDAQIIYTAPENDNFLDDVKNNTLKLGELYNSQEEAEELVANLDEKINEVKEVAQNSNESALFVMANEGELSAYGPGSRFGFIYDDLGLTPVTEDIDASTHGMVISYEFINQNNPGIIFAMDRGAAIGGQSAASDVLDNNVINNVEAVQNDKIIDLDAKVWYLASGGYETTMEQLDEVLNALQ